MGTTTSGLPYPEPTDPVANGAADIKALAEAIDRRTGLILVDSPQTFTTGVVADISWSAAEVSDPDNWATLGSPNLYPPAGKTGRYLVSYTGSWSGDPGPSAAVALYLNSALVADVRASPGSFPGYTHQLTLLRAMNAGDVFRFSAFQNGGANRDLNSRLEIAFIEL